MKVEITRDVAPEDGVLVDLYYESSEGVVADLEDRAIADVARDYPGHLTRIAYSGELGEVVTVRVYERESSAELKATA